MATRTSKKTAATPATPAKPARASKAAKKKTARASKATPAKPARAGTRASTLHKIGRSITGNDLRIYTLAILSLLNMWKGSPVSRKLFVGFYMSASILSNHGRNGSLAVTSESVALTRLGIDFFNARIEDGIATKAEIAALANALKTGAKSKLPDRFAAYKDALYPHPSADGS